jgi:hypothetical protein
MAVDKFCSFNSSRRSFLSSGVMVVDTSREPLVWNGATVPPIGTGIWLKPFRGIPPAHRLPELDLVYLDKSCRVLESIVLSPDLISEPLKGSAESALILPRNTLSSSQTHPGDQLLICTAEELSNRLAGESKSNSSSPLAPAHQVPAPVSSARQSSGSAASSQIVIGKTEAVPQARQAFSIKALLQRWFHSERKNRCAQRFLASDLVAFYWTGGNPEPRKIRDISYDGFYLPHHERWAIGTVVQMTLQRAETDGETPEDFIAVASKVVGWGPDGMSFEYDLADSATRVGLRSSVKVGIRMQVVQRFFERLNLTAIAPSTDEAFSQAG